MKNKVLTVLCVLFAIMFVNAGLNKFFNYMPMPDNLPQKMVDMNKAFMSIGWLLPLVGIVEIIGGVLLVIPKYRALGAIVVFPVMVGIIIANATSAPFGLPLALILFIINLWVIVDNKQKYLPMVQ